MSLLVRALHIFFRTVEYLAWANGGTTRPLQRRLPRWSVFKKKLRVFSRIGVFTMKPMKNIEYVPYFVVVLVCIGSQVGYVCTQDCRVPL
jgi:hypothetical protein